MSNILLVLLRLIHIVSAVAWFGVSFTGWRFLVPATEASGEVGWRFTKSLYTKTAFPIALPATAAIAVIAGILLYLTRDPANNFTQTGQIVLGIGAVIGLLSAGHGGAVTGPITQRMVKLLSGVPDNGPIPSDTLQQLQAENVKFKTHAALSFAMTTLALIFMGSARYL
jgi:hypothetical protein